MKNLLKVSAVSVAFVLAANVANAADKIGFINPQFVVNNHPLLADPNSEFVKSVDAQEQRLAEEDKKLAEEDKALTEEAEKLKKEEAAVTQSLNKKSAALEKEAPRLRSAEIKKRQDAITGEAKAFQKKIANFQAKEAAFKQKVEAFQKKMSEEQRVFAEKRAATEKQVIEQVNAAVKEIAKAKNYTLILDTNTVIYTANETTDDLSEEVLKAVGGTVPAKTETPASK